MNVAEYRGFRAEALVRIAKRMPAELAPTEVVSWLVHPNADLPSGPEEAPTSPLAWLQEGRDEGRVEALAASLEWSGR